LPWTTLKITFTGETNLCCANHDNLGDLRVLSIDEIWNGAPIQQIRKDLVAGKLAESSCRNCPYVGVWPIDNLPSEISAPDSPLQEVVREWDEGAIQVRTRPYELFLYFPFNCNLDCVMCMQVPQRKRGTPNMLPMEESLLAKVKDWCRHNYGRLSMLGGEVFVQKRALELIDFLLANNLDRIHLVITTNGTVLDHFWSKLERFDKLALAFSCDAVRADVYEAIRLKGYWRDVDRNMRRMRRYCHDRPGWGMTLGAVVQRRNLGHLRDIVAYVNDLDVTCMFSQMWGNHAMDENPFLNPGLVNECHHWRKDFDSAIDLAASCPNQTARLTHATLSDVYRRLQEAVESPPVRSQPLVQLGQGRCHTEPAGRRQRLKSTVKKLLPSRLHSIARGVNKLLRV
jgi:MoaA/NifB/PqqE/SkfB family radical SAM enzyme